MKLVIDKLHYCSGNKFLLLIYQLTFQAESLLTNADTTYSAAVTTVNNENTIIQSEVSALEVKIATIEATSETAFNMTEKAKADGRQIFFDAQMMSEVLGDFDTRASGELNHIITFVPLYQSF